MFERTHRLGIVLRSLLLGLLLVAQASAIAHEADHLASGDSGLCAVCSLSAGLDGPVASMATIPGLQDLPVFAPRTPAFIKVAHEAAHCAARAPPHHS